MSDFQREASSLTRTLITAYGDLLRLSKVSSMPHIVGQEAFQLDVAVASLITSGEGLLRLVHELKLSILAQDHAAMEAEVQSVRSAADQRTAALRAEAAQLREEVQRAYSSAANAPAQNAAP